MNVQVPSSVMNRPPGTLVPAVIRGEVMLYVRETAWGLRRLPPACPAELRLGSWEFENVVIVTLLVRLARNDAATFDCQLDVRSALGMRILQYLSSQAQVEVHVASEESVRTFRAANPDTRKAAQLVAMIQDCEPWSAEQAERALARLNQLYPTPHALWWMDAARARS
jgi:hypothetical protein